jgi:dTMP kinase
MAGDESGQGFFLVIEGLDGAGKSSAARGLARILQAPLADAGGTVSLTFEPHDPSCAGDFIRGALTRRIEGVDPFTLALAFAVNRADHNDRLIGPFLEANPLGLLICDRYLLSSLAFQSSDDLSFEEIMDLNRRARRPDLTLFLDVSTSTARARMASRGQDEEYFESRLEQTREAYGRAIEYLRARGHLIVEIDAEGDLHEVVRRSLDAVAEHGPPWLAVPPQEPSAVSGGGPGLGA